MSEPKKWETVPITEQLNGDGTLQYLRYNYKGSITEIRFGYKDGKRNQIIIPSYLNFSHKDLFELVSKYYVHVANTPDMHVTNTPDMYVANTPAYFDRAGKAIIYSTGGTSTTMFAESWSYTVPQKRKAKIELLQCGVQWVNNFAVGENIASAITLKPKDGVESDLLVAYKNYGVGADPSIYTEVSKTLSSGYLFEGDTLKGYIGANNLHPFANYINIAQLTEFDA